VRYWLPITAALTVAAVSRAEAYAAVAALLLWPSLAGCIRRLHDLNLGGSWCFTFWFATMGLGISGLYVPGPAGETLAWFALALATFVPVWVLGVVPGTNGDNRFGEDPANH
jgi:uncharacterized membrane protein YhaH (DUF805 family)